MRFGFVIAVLCGLIGCSDEPQPGLEAVKQAIGSRKQKLPTADEIRATATPKALAQIGRPVKLAELPALGLADILIYVQQNGAYATWASSDSVSFVFKDGLLTGTRGMGFDLMTVDLGYSSQAIRQGRGQTRRVYRHLNGEDQMVAQTVTCQYSRAQGGLVKENCSSEEISFENQYWVGKGGRITKSRQWISPERGYLISERLS